MTTRRTPPSSGPLTIEWRPPDQITPYETNPRLIPQSAIDKVADSLAAYGWQQPIVPFCGSGTAIVAAELAGRSCCAIELSPVFRDVVVERYRRLTGQEVRRDG
jgi:hypothetical protein